MKPACQPAPGLRCLAWQIMKRAAYGRIHEAIRDLHERKLITVRDRGGMPSVLGLLDENGEEERRGERRSAEPDKKSSGEHPGHHLARVLHYRPGRSIVGQAPRPPGPVAAPAAESPS